MLEAFPDRDPGIDDDEPITAEELEGWTEEEWQAEMAAAASRDSNRLLALLIVW